MYINKDLVIKTRINQYDIQSQNVTTDVIALGGK